MLTQEHTGQIKESRASEKLYTQMITNIPLIRINKMNIIQYLITVENRIFGEDVTNK